MEGICYYIHIEIRNTNLLLKYVSGVHKIFKEKGGNHMLDTAAAGLVLTGEDKEIVDMVHDFVLKEVRPKAAEHDISGELDWDAYNKAFEMGLVCADLPAEYGGQGLSNVSAAWIREELMYGDAGFGLTCGTNNLGIKPVLIAGTEEQKKWCVEVLTSDKPGRDPRWPKKRSGCAAFALTEPEAGSDAGACKTTAEKILDEDGNVKEYVLNGRKCFITNACYADFMCVVASIDRSLGYKGLTMFLVDAHLPGISIGKHEDKMGIRQSATCDVLFEDVHIPASALIGKEGEGFKIAMMTLDGGRIGIASQALGIAEGALQETVAYVKERKQFGRSISAFQNTQFELAEMKARIEAAKYLVYAAALKKQEAMNGAKVRYSVEAAEAKLIAARTASDVTRRCLQLFGGYGYTRDYPIERMMRDAKITEIYEGTSEVQMMVISGALLK